MAAHRDDPFGAELFGSKDTEQADGSVADDGDGFSRPGVRCDRSEPASPQHVGCGEVVRDQPVVGDVRAGDECAVGERDPHRLGLRRTGAFIVDAGRLVPDPAYLAGVVGGDERSDDELARLDRADRAADVLDDAGVLVAHR